MIQVTMTTCYEKKFLEADLGEEANQASDTRSDHDPQYPMQVSVIITCKQQFFCVCGQGFSTVRCFW